MKKFLVSIAFALCCLSSFSQKHGFFNIYELAEKSFCASAIIETDDDCLIVAVFDYYGGAGELIKLSKEGEMLKRLSLSDNSVFSGIDGLYRDPFQSNLFVGIGHIWYMDAQIAKPFIIHFDDDLNLIDQNEIDLPGEYHRFDMTRSLLTRDGDFIYATSLGSENNYHLLYMRIALDGTLKCFYEETEGCAFSIMINAIFEFPEGNYFGDYRSSYRVHENYNQQQRLFGFDDRFVFDTIHEFDPIIQQLNSDTSYTLTRHTNANGTVQPLNDTTLLFSDRVHEMWFQISTGALCRVDHSTLLSSADLEGNTRKYLVIGSDNDTTEVPFAFNAIAIAKESATNENSVYHGCFGYNVYLPDYIPNNVTITKTDENLNVKWQKSYTHATRFLQATYLLAMHDGCCLAAGGAYDYVNNHSDLFLLKINPDGTVGTDEIVVTSRSFVYPNPGRNKIKVESPNENSVIRICNLQGRVVLSKRFDFAAEINIESLPSGIYCWEIWHENQIEASGKWVKE